MAGLQDAKSKVDGLTQLVEEVKQQTVDAHGKAVAADAKADNVMAVAEHLAPALEKLRETQTILRCQPESIPDTREDSSETANAETVPPVDLGRPDHCRGRG